jgi:hypothetical protein
VENNKNLQQRSVLTAIVVTKKLIISISQVIKYTHSRTAMKKISNFDVAMENKAIHTGRSFTSRT